MPPESPTRRGSRRSRPGRARATRRRRGRAAEATDPEPADVLRYLYTDTVADVVPVADRAVSTLADPPVAKRDAGGAITYRDALREALVEEMLRDRRVVVYGEDVADYGGAFKLTKGLLETFGRQRVFNTPICEAGICGTAVGAAMAGLRPVVELMYMDFALMASDQIANQAGKWHYMSGAQVEVPLVIRASVGAGKGYGGQHSQSLESVFTHIPGLYVVYPATPADAKGLLKRRSARTTRSCSSRARPSTPRRASCPRASTSSRSAWRAWSAKAATRRSSPGDPPCPTHSRPRSRLRAEHGDRDRGHRPARLVPLDMETVLASVRKTGRCVVASQAVLIGSFVNEIVARIQLEVFDYLDAPVGRVGAANGISPQAESLERAFLPNCRRRSRARSRPCCSTSAGTAGRTSEDTDGASRS